MLPMFLAGLIGGITLGFAAGAVLLVFLQGKAGL